MYLNDLVFLTCPSCGSHDLHWTGRLVASRLDYGVIDCLECRARWDTVDGLPRLYREERVSRVDRVMRSIYDGLPALHNAAVRYMLPVMQLGGSEETLRSGYIRRLELESLRPPADRPLRILEVGVGAGANLPLVLERLPAGVPVEYWGLDLSEGMLGQCRKLVRRRGYNGVRLMVGDAHRLPFADHTFDRVFHVGGIGGFGDPGQALAEMGRVARPDTPIVVVDEQLDPKRRHGLYSRLMFFLVTFYDVDPKAPTNLLPARAESVLEEQVSRFYYSLRFRMPT